MKTSEVLPQDMADHEIGLEIARVLGLRRKRENGRFDTTHGDKNPCGLARTLRHLSAGPLEKSAPELLAACESALATFKAQFPLEHGNHVIGAAWGELESAISKAKGGEA